MRPPMLPRISTSINTENMESKMTTSPCLPQSSPGHSRNSSGASSASMSIPMTPTFSFRNHSRWPSSSSSMATSPDSPITMGKTSLDDLVEEPAEIDGGADENDNAFNASFEEFCICDTVFCKHQQARSATYPTPPPSSPEWIPGDDLVDFVEPARSLKSQRSAAELSVGKTSSRFSRHWPSISSRWRDRRPTTSISSPAVRSAPPSRSSSTKQHSVKHSLVSFLDPQETFSLFSSDGQDLYDFSRRPSSPTLPEPLGLEAFEDVPDPIDRQEHASTPLLPPLLAELRTQHDETFQSPLQSPSIASPSSAATFADTPLSSPAFTSVHTPALSAKPSFASLSRVRSNHMYGGSIDGMTLADQDQMEYYNLKLGHANFHILPEPYMPEVCDKESCLRLRDDWETARLDWMRQSYAISLNYGPTSNTIKYATEKFNLIDQQWQINIERTHAEAGIPWERKCRDHLAETVAVSQIPSLPYDPEHPEKFPTPEEGCIVGPMIQYKKVQRTPSKKKNFLKLLLEPAGLFGTRSRSASSH